MVLFKRLKCARSHVSQACKSLIGSNQTANLIWVKSQPEEHPLLLIGCQFTLILILYYLFAMYVCNLFTFHIIKQHYSLIKAIFINICFI